MTTTNLAHGVRVRHIGFMAAGSFGLPGMPKDGCDLYRVDCPELDELIAAAHPALCPEYGRFTYAHLATAEAAAVRQAVREQERIDERHRSEAAAKEDADRKARTGVSIARAIERHTGEPITDRLVWTDKLSGRDRMTAESAAAIDAMPGPSGGDYDARVGGRYFRVRLPHFAARGGAVVEVALAKEAVAV